MSLLKENIIRKEQIDKNVTEFETNNSKKYKIEAVWNSIVYTNKAKSYLPDLYYLVT